MNRVCTVCERVCVHVCKYMCVSKHIYALKCLHMHTSECFNTLKWAFTFADFCQLGPFCVKLLWLVHHKEIMGLQFG